MQGSFTGWLILAMGLAFLIPGFILTVLAYKDNKNKVLGVEVLLAGMLLAYSGILVLNNSVGIMARLVLAVIAFVVTFFMVTRKPAMTNKAKWIIAPMIAFIILLFGAILLRGLNL